MAQWCAKNKKGAKMLDKRNRFVTAILAIMALAIICFFTVRAQERVSEEIQEGQQYKIETVTLEPEGAREAEPEAEVETEPKVEPELKAELEPEAEPKLENQAEAEAEFESEAAPEAEAEAEPEPEPELESEAEHDPEPEPQSDWGGDALTPWAGVVQGPSGLETYYNLNMDGVVSIMRGMGYDESTYPYWVREDGVKMLGDYIICAANLDIHPRGSIVDTSLGTAIVCDTGSFSYSDPYQIDIAVNW